MSKLELKLYDFTPAIEKLMGEIEAHTDEDGQWVEGGRPFEDIVQDVMNMEQGKKEKILSIGHLILHLDECAERHEAHKAKHAKKEKSFEAQAKRLREYIKGNSAEGDKFKDDFVSIYSQKSAAVIPLVTVENLPVEYRRPVLVKSDALDRSVVDRLDIACKTKGMASPFAWDVDKETLKKDIKALPDGQSHPWGRLETSRSIVVR